MRFVGFSRLGGTVLGLLLLLGLAGCATVVPPVVVKTGDGPRLDQAVASHPRVLLLAPCLNYSDVSTDAPLKPENFGGPEAASVFTRETVAGLRKAGFTVVIPDSVAPEVQSEARGMRGPRQPLQGQEGPAADPGAVG
jgi:hypothetical protein